jgi:hypothetical protein
MSAARVSGLSDAHAAEARAVILKGVDLLMRDPAGVHYTQGPDRWSAINQKLRIADGKHLTRGDCSSTGSWLLWNALTHVGVSRDLVNATAWRSGFTGTMAVHGKRVVQVEHAKIGDAVLYGPAPTFEHVAVYIGGGRVFSHGSEAGPFLLPIDYRPDRGMIRRYI